MTSPHTPITRAHKRTPVAIEVIVNGVLNQIEGRICDLSEGGARIDGASMPARSRCEIHYGGQVVYAIVMWSEFDRMGVAASAHPAQIFLSNRSAGFGRRGLS